jgi:hypothetical protein
MSKRAVCVGINNYPGTFNDLKGCVNDANDWADLFKEVFKFDDVKTLLDGDAKATAITDALMGLVEGASAGDIVVFTYSGHGTWVYDQGERDESDNRDEAWCGHDDIILDDTLRTIVRRMNPKARLTIIADSCHSGTSTRTMLERAARGRAEEPAERAPKPRYMPPLDDLDAIRTNMIPIRTRMAYPESGMSEILLTGCNAEEYSYDAYIGGKFNGAMSAKAIDLIRNDPKATYKEFHRNLRLLLPTTQYPQSPQLEGSKENKKCRLFE